MGWYWVEVRTYLGKYSKIKWLFVFTILSLTHLTLSGKYPILSNSVYIGSISPFVAMNRFYYNEYSERKKRKTIFS